MAGTALGWGPRRAALRRGPRRVRRRSGPAGTIERTRREVPSAPAARPHQEQCEPGRM